MLVRTLLVCTFVWLLMPLPADAQEAAPEGLVLLVEKIGSDPVPYQAVRLRITLRNNGKKAVADLPLVESACGITGFQKPGQKQFSAIDTNDKIILPRYELGRTRHHSLVAQNQRLVLKPGEEESIISSFAGPVDKRSLALFPESGDYSLRLEYARTMNGGASVKPALVHLTVRKLEGEDRAACSILENQRVKVTEDFTQSIIYREPPPGFETHEALKKIIREHPKSSYANFGRFMEAQRLLQWNILGGKTPKEMPKAELDQAVAYLKAINLKQYPYGADALLLLRKINEEYIGDAKEVKRIEAQLEAEFKDDLAWIEAQSERIPLEKLMEDSKKPPVQRGPRNPKP